eukprot:GDKJ01020319.1.p1 GENE.GDKJ01020319.1~~GDKJ01020319.1.p1  ORF type:complete len:405 (+),score=39.84 GDKJ01020319.1:51-1265(+)
MFTVLSVAEKPSVAREITKHLSGGNSRRVNNPGMPCDEFEFNFRGSRCRMLVTSVRGHLMTLDFPPEYSWGKCPETSLFTAPLKKSLISGTEGIATALSNFAQQSSHLVLWLDCDREGENIAFEVIEACSAGNRNLDIHRAHFSALSYSDINRAWNTLGRPNILLSEAVMARQEIDLRIGAAFTRLWTGKMRSKFQVGSVVSYGPCQFPTLGLVVERWEKVIGHRPQPFWGLDLFVETEEEKTLKMNWRRGNLFDFRTVLSLLQGAIYLSNQPDGGLGGIPAANGSDPSNVQRDVNNRMHSLNLSAKVVNYSGREAFKYPPLPMNTITLTALASSHLRMPSAHTMTVAEGLYHAGYLSYPRTETNKYAPTHDLASNLRSLCEQDGFQSNWSQYGRALLSKATLL